MHMYPNHLILNTNDFHHPSNLTNPTKIKTIFVVSFYLLTHLPESLTQLIRKPGYGQSRSKNTVLLGIYKWLTEIYTQYILHSNTTTICNLSQFSCHALKTLHITFVARNCDYTCGKFITFVGLSQYCKSCRFVLNLWFITVPLWAVITLVGVRKGFTVTLWFAFPQLSQSQGKIKQISLLTNQKSNSHFHIICTKSDNKAFVESLKWFLFLLYKFT